MTKLLQDRIKTLEDISGLVVVARIEKSQNVFDFFDNGVTVKTVFTYNKAKLFAEGVQYGRNLTLKIALDLLSE
jgi:hypothetical protein